MRVSTRVGRGTYLSMGCLGWTLILVVIIGLIGAVIQWLAHL
jgi:hypothetical protein